MPPTPKSLTPELVRAHESLHLQVSTLLRQVERGALGRPAAPVPPASLAAARSLFEEGRRLLRPAPRLDARDLSDLAALAVQLGQLVAALETFEAAHSVWIAAENCICWEGTDGPQPIARLLPRQTRRPEPPKERPGEAEAVRDKLTRQLLVRENARYMQGYRHGQQGREALPPIRKWDTDVAGWQ